LIGASCHSVEEALEAENLHCSYITAGHIFSTDCKKGVAPRGLNFLSDVCNNVSIPVYAIGGINQSNMKAVQNAGANGVCIMSGFMIS
jgi:thiamine-phosphate pyrophosphorylase